MGQKYRRNPGVIIDHLRLGEAGGGVEDFFQVGKFKVFSLYFHLDLGHAFFFLSGLSFFAAVLSLVAARLASRASIKLIIFAVSLGFGCPTTSCPLALRSISSSTRSRYSSWYFSGSKSVVSVAISC